MVEEQKVINLVGQPIHFTLTKNAKGNYQWEVSIYAETVEDAKAKTEAATKWLEEKYGNQGGKPE